jgi:hypothetical protein
MTKPNSRQIIILSVMFLAVLYGAYDFYSNSRKKAQPASSSTGTSADLSAFISDLTVALSKDTPSPVDAYMIKKAETPWIRDPFFERSSYRDLLSVKEPAPGTAATGAPSPSTPKSQFNYTGYVDVGHKIIAIVNGSEYAVGAALDIENFVLNGIFPSKIVIYNKETKRTLDVPLQE